LLVAVTVAVAFCVTAAAVYLPEASIVPTLELPPAAPFTDHVTPELSPVTIAVNCTELTGSDHCRLGRNSDGDELLTLTAAAPSYKRKSESKARAPQSFSHLFT
jgi:hypothetical protein